MGRNSGIEWCDHTFNGWWGCTKVSEGCANCYAETLSVNRRGLHVWGAGADRKITKTIWRDPIKWNREAEKAGERRVVFCLSMGDFFEDRPDLIEPRMRTFDLIGQTPWLYWLLLTKRPENMLSLVPESWRDGWPENTMALTSVENQEWADIRMPQLLQVPARRGLSIEPLIGPIHCLDLEGIDWVIVGGESQKAARPMHIDWPRSIHDECQAKGIPYFFKQWGEWLHESQIGNTCSVSKATEHRWPDGSVSYRVGKKSAGGDLDGETWKEMSIDVSLETSKGGKVS